MTFHPEAISTKQHEVLHRLGPIISEVGFYLGGGTALALNLGHRRSVDFDWFTGDRIADPLRLAQHLRDAQVDFSTGQIARGTLHGTIAGVRLSFLEYRYPLLQSTIPWPRYYISLASLDDLACMKLSAIVQRGAKKDFVDVFALVKEHKSLPELLNLYRRKYETDDIAHLLYALVYFDDADRERMPKLLWPLDWRTIKQQIRDWVHELAG
jgi:hypothetical protein